jgi:cytochrome c556
MTEDIDMKSLTGADFVPAAGEYVESNSYDQEASDYPVNVALLDQPVKTQVDESAKEPGTNPQAENFRAFREEVDRMKAERDLEKREFQLQLEMLRANMQAKHSQPEQPQERKFLGGMDESDVPSVGELRKEFEQREAQYAARIEELQVQQAHPDYAEVIEKYALPLVQQKPHLAEGLRGASNKALFAYELGKMAQRMQAPVQAAAKSDNAQRIVDNAKKPGTLSQAGGQGALSKADYFASMSDQEFMQMASRNLEGI